MKVKSRLRTISSFLLIATPSISYSVAYQIFPNIAYENSAALNNIKNAEVTVGTTVPSVKFKFSGRYDDVHDSASSHETDILPYGRFAKRITPKLVATLDVTHPMLADIQFPKNSFISTLAINTILRDTNYSPKLSYQLTDRLALGLGLDANKLSTAEISFAVSPFGTLKNRGDSFDLGWDAGLFYVINPTTFANLSYYSKVVHHIEGKSTWGASVSHHWKSKVVLPATSTINVVHLCNPKLALSAMARYIQWDDEQTLPLINTALPASLIMPLKYKNAWNGQLATRYQWTEKLAVKGAIEYDGNAQSTLFRPIGLPTDKVIVFGLGAEYAFNKSWNAQLLYAHGFSNPAIKTVGALGNARGHERANANIIDLSLTWRI